MCFLKNIAKDKVRGYEKDFDNFGNNGISAMRKRGFVGLFGWVQKNVFDGRVFNA